MRKISAMYKWSGGTDYTHVCKECKNCVKVKKGGRWVFKCLVYGNTNSEATDWKEYNIACKAFDIDPPERPLIETGISRNKEKEKEMQGQMTLEGILY